MKTKLPKTPFKDTQLFKRRTVDSSLLIILVALYFVVVFNFAFLKKVFGLYEPTHSLDLFFYSIPVVLTALLTIVFSLLIVPFVHRLIVPILILLSSAVSYNVLMYNVYFDRDMLDNVLQTTPAESVRMFSVSFILWLLLTGVLPAIFYVRIRLKTTRWYKEILKRLLIIVISLATLATVAGFYYQTYAAFFRNNISLRYQIVPSGYIGAIHSKIKQIRRQNMPYTVLGKDAKLKKDDSLRNVLVLIVGETTRKQNWGLSGYHRQTTPLLAKRLANGEHLFNFDQTQSCGTATAHSVPCMFSSMTQKTYEPIAALHQDNLMDVLQYAGIQTRWIENNSSCKGVCQHIPTIDVMSLNLPEFCTNGHCLDNIMLPQIDKALANDGNDVVLVLHTLGNHGPTYYERYTKNERLFTPTCDTKEINSCSQGELVNTYDNGVVYVDQFIDKVIANLQKYPNAKTSVLYAADHGESLGENGFYLHGAPLAIAPKEQTSIPMILWVSDTWAKHSPYDLKCVANQKSNPYSHDNFFHTALAMTDIDLTSVKQYDEKLDILANCKRQ